MPNTLEIQPQQTLELPRSNPGPFDQLLKKSLSTVATPEKDALQPPRVDPVMTVSGMGTGSIGEAFGSILKDVALQHILSSIASIRNLPAKSPDEFPAPPKDYAEGYYPPSKWAPPRKLVPHAETDILPSTRFRGAGATRRFGDYDKPPVSPKSYKEDLPDYVKMHNEYSGPEFLKRLGSYGEEGPPNPQDLIWHALGLGPEVNFTSTARSIQDEGLSSGWFSANPNPHFGNLRFGAKPEDLPPLTTRTRTLMVDPPIEIIPDWGAGPGSGHAIPEKTISGNYVNRSIHPSKFTVIDSNGNLLGKLAEQREGEKATTSLGKKLFQQILEGAE